MTGADLVIHENDLNDAIKGRLPSGLREVVVSSPAIHWDDIGGLDYVKVNTIEILSVPKEWYK